MYSFCYVYVCLFLCMFCSRYCVSLCCTVYCKCVLYYCHRVSTQVQLRNVSNITKLCIACYIPTLSIPCYRASHYSFLDRSRRSKANLPRIASSHQRWNVRRSLRHGLRLEACWLSVCLRNVFSF
jgi:hypothetical protein